MMFEYVVERVSRIGASRWPKIGGLRNPEIMEMKTLVLDVGSIERDERNDPGWTQR